MEEACGGGGGEVIANRVGMGFDIYKLVFCCLLVHELFHCQVYYIGCKLIPSIVPFWMPEFRHRMFSRLLDSG